MLKAAGMLGVRGSLLKAHRSVRTGVNAACFPPGYILWLAVWYLMKCVFMLHLLVLYKLSLSANFHGTSLRFLLALSWFYYSRTVTQFLWHAHTRTEKSCLTSITLEKEFRMSWLQIIKLILNLLVGFCLWGYHSCNGQVLYSLVVAHVRASTCQ